MGKKQMISAAIVTGERSLGRPFRAFRANAADLAEKVAAIEASIADMKANIEAITMIVDKISRS